ncbi:hypothetical protein FOL47_006450 [Perkinsus chesapeaki]|uniref:C3H1-type domain-containing protein n=1 Tax=Perkinsus chesapeaki TaxID=330153 RepID=A0A7J6MY15_PERCH|nr:hypothetical protein FOL47_006450 [Perkinsus chesapeaki]
MSEQPKAIFSNARDAWHNRYLNQFYKTEMCKFVANGGCSKGESCSHAHSEAELRNKPDLSKTRMCRMMLQKGTCPNIKRCPYAHDIKQVRSTNAFFKTKLCSFHQEGFCKLGNKCRYAHSESELNPDDWPVGNDVNIVENPNIRERSSSKASSASTAPSEPDYDCSQLRNTPTTRRSFGPLFEDESTVERSLEDPVIDQTSMMMSTYPGHFYHYYMYAPHPPMVDLVIRRAGRVLSASDEALSGIRRISIGTQTSVPLGEEEEDGRRMKMFRRLFEKTSYERFIEDNDRILKWDKAEDSDENTEAELSRKVGELAKSASEEVWTKEIFGVADVILKRISRTSKAIKEARLPTTREEWITGGHRGIYTLAAAKACGDALRDLELWLGELMSLLEVYNNTVRGLMKKQRRLEKTVESCEQAAQKLRIDNARLERKVKYYESTGSVRRPYASFLDTLGSIGDRGGSEDKNGQEDSSEVGSVPLVDIGEMVNTGESRLGQTALAEQLWEGIKADLEDSCAAIGMTLEGVLGAGPTIEGLLAKASRRAGLTGAAAAVVESIGEEGSSVGYGRGGEGGPVTGSSVGYGRGGQGGPVTGSSVGYGRGGEGGSRGIEDSRQRPPGEVTTGQSLRVDDGGHKEQQTGGTVKSHPSVGGQLIWPPVDHKEGRTEEDATTTTTIRHPRPSVGKQGYLGTEEEGSLGGGDGAITREKRGGEEVAGGGVLYENGGWEASSFEVGNEEPSRSSRSNGAPAQAGGGPMVGKAGDSTGPVVEAITKFGYTTEDIDSREQISSGDQGLAAERAVAGAAGPAAAAAVAAVAAVAGSEVGGMMGEYRVDSLASVDDATVAFEEGAGGSIDGGKSDDVTEDRQRGRRRPSTGCREGGSSSVAAGIRRRSSLRRPSTTAASTARTPSTGGDHEVVGQLRPTNEKEEAMLGLRRWRRGVGLVSVGTQPSVEASYRVSLTDKCQRAVDRLIALVTHFSTPTHDDHCDYPPRLHWLLLAVNSDGANQLARSLGSVVDLLHRVALVRAVAPRVPSGVPSAVLEVLRLLPEVGHQLLEERAMKAGLPVSSHGTPRPLLRRMSTSALGDTKLRPGVDELVRLIRMVEDYSLRRRLFGSLKAYERPHLPSALELVCRFCRRKIPRDEVNDGGSTRPTSVASSAVGIRRRLLGSNTLVALGGDMVYRDDITFPGMTVAYR